MGNDKLANTEFLMDFNEHRSFDMQKWFVCVTLTTQISINFAENQMAPILSTLEFIVTLSVLL